MFMATIRAFTRFLILNNSARQTNIRITFTRRRTTRCSRNKNNRARLFNSRRNRRSSITPNLRLSINLRPSLPTGIVRSRYLLHLQRSRFKERSNMTSKTRQEDAYSPFNSQCSSTINFDFYCTYYGYPSATFQCRLRTCFNAQISVFRIRSRLY